MSNIMSFHEIQNVIMSCDPMKNCLFQNTQMEKYQRICDIKLWNDMLYMFKNTIFPNILRYIVGSFWFLIGTIYLP